MVTLMTCQVCEACLETAAGSRIIVDAHACDVGVRRWCSLATILACYISSKSSDILQGAEIWPLKKFSCAILAVSLKDGVTYVSHIVVLNLQ